MSVHDHHAVLVLLCSYRIQCVLNGTQSRVQTAKTEKVLFLGKVISVIRTYHAGHRAITFDDSVLYSKGPFDFNVFVRISPKQKSN